MNMTDEERGALGKLASMLVKRYPKTGTIPLTKNTTVRLPVDDVAWLDAFAKHAQTNRNAVCVQVIKAGIEETLSKLDEDTRRLLDSLRLEALDKLVQEHGKRSEGELFEGRE